MKMKVLKFGGTSVGSALRMHKLVELINNNEPKIVVLSAMSGTTNALVEIANAFHQRNFSRATELIKAFENNYLNVIDELFATITSLHKAEKFLEEKIDLLHSFSKKGFSNADECLVLAQGELISTTLFHYYLEEIKIESVLLPALEFMRTDANEEPDMKQIEKLIEEELKKYPSQKLFITQGYICKNAKGEIDNLKRGGSDYTATIIGAAIDSSEIQIWTDIDGMHNNDPRVVKNTHPIAQLSFDEAAELAYFGAKILHPTCILPAKDKKIPVRLLNTMQPEAAGTLINKESQGDNIKAVAAKDGITAIKIKSGRMLLAYGFLSTVFEIFERNKTSIDMITTSEVAVSLTIDNTKNLEKILEELKEFGTVDVDENQTIICIVGDFEADKQGYAVKVFDSLKNIPIRMISYGGSENNISVLVNSEFKNQALVALNEGLF